MEVKEMFPKNGVAVSVKERLILSIIQWRLLDVFLLMFLSS